MRKSRDQLIQEHYDAIANALAKQRHIAQAEARSQLDRVGFTVEYQRNPDTYLHIMPGDLVDAIVRRGQLMVQGRSILPH